LFIFLLKQKTQKNYFIVAENAISVLTDEKVQLKKENTCLIFYVIF